MSPRRDTIESGRVLILTPSGNDAAITGEVLHSADIHSTSCEDIFALTAQLKEGAGALLISEEGLDSDRVSVLGAALAAQEPWSDISLLIITRASASDDTGQQLLHLFAPHGSVTLLERPLRPATLISAVQAAFRARGRQYQVRELLREQQRTLDLAQKAERRYRAIFDQQFQFMAILSPEGVVTEINDLPLLSTGISRPEVVGHLFWKTPFWKDLPKMQAEWSVRLVRAAQSDGPLISVDQYETADGQIRVADAAITAVKNRDGTVAFFIVQASDITERNNAELALERKTRRLQHLADVAGDLLSTESPERIVRDVYRRFAGELEIDAYLNYLTRNTPDQLVLDSYHGIPDALVGRASQLALGEAICGAVALGREPRVIGCVQQSTDPATEIIRAAGLRAYAVFPLLVSNQLLGTLSFGKRRGDSFSMDDIEYLQTVSNFIALAQYRALYQRDLEATVENRTAELKTKIGELEAFSYSASHDLRAPLRAMQGYAEVLLEEHSGSLNEEGRHFLNRIVISANRLDQLVSDILTYSQVARGEVSTTVIDLDRSIQDVIRAYPALQAAQIEVQSPLDDVIGHEASLFQCVSNLLGNAVKFVPAGTRPSIQISTERRGQVVRLWFRDNGIGISPRDQERIFQIFEKGGPGGKYEGTGIGLAIVQKAVERMGGRVGVVSELGHGSQFWLELPTTDAKSAEIPAM